MHRMGHGPIRAALIYQHATSELDREIAQALSKRIYAATHGDQVSWITEQDSGPLGARAANHTT
jgi:hypothetical protein